MTKEAYTRRKTRQKKRVCMTGGVISNRPSRFRRPNYWTSHQQMPLDGGDNPAKPAKPAKPDSRSHTYRQEDKTDMKMKTRRQRYDNEDPSAGHDSTPPHSKMMSSSSERGIEEKTKPTAQALTTNTLPLIMATQRSTSVGLGRFSATVLLKNKDQKPPKYEKMNCVDTTECHNHQRFMHRNRLSTTPTNKNQIKRYQKMAIPNSSLSSHTKAKITPINSQE